MRGKFLVDIVDVLTQLSQTPSSRLFPCIVLAISHQTGCLQPMSDRTGACGLTDCRAVADCDLEFVLDDGSRVPASRRVMALSSDVFAAMLSGRFRESREREIRIAAAEPAAFRTMVQWLHAAAETSDAADRSGRSPELDELCELIPLFHRFQIPDTVRRRTLFSPLMSAVFDDDEVDGKFARVYRLLTIYDDVGDLRRNFVVSLFTRQMSLRRRCAAVARVVSAESECDVDEFLSIIIMSFLRAVNC